MCQNNDVNDMHFWHLISQYNKFTFACFVFGRSFYLLSFSFLFWTKISIYSYSLVCLFLGNCCTKFPLNEIQINILKVVFLFQSFTSPKKRNVNNYYCKYFFYIFRFFPKIYTCINLCLRIMSRHSSISIWWRKL